MPPAPQPFRIAASQDALDDLARRLKATRWPAAAQGAGWTHGADPAYMRRLLAYWREEYDWRRAEAELNRLPQFTAPVPGPDGDPLTLHFLHLRGQGPRPRPLLLTHGWPGSIAEFVEILGPLSDPARFGGRAEDAFDVVAPSLPGYIFSQAPKRPIGPRAVAGMLDRLMREVLGYERYYAQGGDWGSIISAWLALDRPEHLAAIHLNMVPLRPHLDAAAPLSPEEKAWIAAARQQLGRENAYQMIQATKSQTLAYALADSPAGLAAWIVEKFHGWSDPEAAEPPFPMARLLTNVMLYWITGSMPTATWLYRGVREEGSLGLPAGRRIEVPMGFCLPPHDLAPRPPAAWLARLGDVQHRTDLNAGGHFTAMQAGEELVADMRGFFRRFPLA